MHVGDGAWVEQMSGDSAAIWEGSRRGFDVENNRREGSGWDRAFGWALLRGDTTSPEFRGFQFVSVFL